MIVKKKKKIISVTKHYDMKLKEVKWKIIIIRFHLIFGKQISLINRNKIKNLSIFNYIYKGSGIEKKIINWDSLNQFLNF